MTFLLFVVHINKFYNQQNEKENKTNFFIFIKKKKKRYKNRK
jgi:hypothetical protein